ncbi:hypothetical protein JCM14469_43450 [Desulfatiferula olefinivorans]
MEKIFTEYLVYIPLVLPSFEERALLIDSYEEEIEEIVSFVKQQKLETLNNFVSRPNVKLSKSIDNLPFFKNFWLGNPSPFWGFWFLEISSTFEFTLDDVEKYLKAKYDSDVDTKIDLYKYLGGLQIEKLCNDLLLAVTIAKLGFIKTNQGLLFYDGKFHSKIDGTHSLFYEAFKEAKKIEWPPLAKVTLKEVWDWLHKFSFFEEQTGEGRFGRAIASITHIMQNDFSDAIDDLNLDVVWALIGLEAIYGNGNVGLKNQIIEKSQVFLGKPEKFKKLLSQAYDLRSRVIHGDVDIPFKYSNSDTAIKHKGSSTDLGEARLITLAVLLSTVQKLILEDRNELSFKYQIQ